ncbi:hypothetical protein D7Z54_24465 [Salibacterium salarium]|uniref:Uncharacterized protein n=1 Tax=Salibacterium salarium TaxID=284579 RepID=A0A428MXC2_9BACI|nr:hypothetical protein D7Z54_24465 [Salibacterium salarium]
MSQIGVGASCADLSRSSFMEAVAAAAAKKTLDNKRSELDQMSLLYSGVKASRLQRMLLAK